MTCHRPPSLGDLNTGRTGANDGTLLAFDRDLIVRPERRMMKDASELLDAGPIRDVSLSSEAGADDQILGFRSPAISCLDVPASFVSLELSISDDTLEGCLAFDVKNLVAGVEVIPQVMIVRVVVWPVVSGACQF